MAMRFDGVDDYINLGNIYDDLNLPITVSAWVYIDPTATLPGPILTTQDNDQIYNGFWFFASKSEIIFEYGDGLGADNPAFRKGKKATIPIFQHGRWNHVAGVMRSGTDVQVYINGINVGGSSSGTSTSPMASVFPNDVAKIGYHLSNSIVYRFKGLMDELRLYNRALSEAEIRQQMCKKLSGTETGLIGYWDFNETSGSTLIDKSINHFDGELIGNPARVFSGAPIGDESTFLYTTNWTSKSVELDIEVDNIKGNPEGVHIYKVFDEPSQTAGLPNGISMDPYYGIFLASLDQGNTFDLKYNNASLCEAFGRSDNSLIPWTSLTSTTSIQNRIEIIPIISINNEVVYLGPDKVVCDQPSHSLQTGLTDLSGKSFLWSTGETSPTITIVNSGLYSVQVFNSCNVMNDTINVLFSEKPVFDLGTDGLYCLEIPKILSPYEDSSGKEYHWQDGSSGPTFEVKSTGSYWVKIENICGVSADTIHISKEEIGEVNIGPDKVVCDQQFYSLESGVTNYSGKTLVWSNGETSPSITISKSGLYSLQVSNRCSTIADTANIIFLNKPEVFSLGSDELTCTLEPRILTPYEQTENLNFLWQDGSIENTFYLQDYGVFWVKVENACGVATDTIHIARPITQFGFIPNIITPNDDGFNQFFEIEVVGDDSYRLMLFNRWGEEVFSSSDYKNDWDGSDLPSGVYFYRLSGECLDERRGSVTIVR